MTSLPHLERLLLEAQAVRQEAHEPADGLASEPLIPLDDLGAIGPAEDSLESRVDDGPASPMIELAASQAQARAWNQTRVEASSPALDGARSWGAVQPAPATTFGAEALENPPRRTDSAAQAAWSNDRPLSPANWSNSLAAIADPPATPGDAWSRPATVPSIAASGSEVLGALDSPRASPAWDADRPARDPAAAFDGGSSARSDWTSSLVSAAGAQAPPRGSNAGARADATESGASLTALLDDLEKLRTAARRTAHELDRIRGPVQPALPALPPNHGSFRI